MPPGSWTNHARCMGKAAMHDSCMNSQQMVKTSCMDCVCWAHALRLEGLLALDTCCDSAALPQQTRCRRWRLPFRRCPRHQAATVAGAPGAHAGGARTLQQPAMETVSRLVSDVRWSSARADTWVFDRSRWRRQRRRARCGRSELETASESARESHVRPRSSASPVRPAGHGDAELVPGTHGRDACCQRPPVRVACRGGYCAEAGPDGQCLTTAGAAAWHACMHARAGRGGGGTVAVVMAGVNGG